MVLRESSAVVVLMGCGAVFLGCGGSPGASATTKSSVPSAVPSRAAEAATSAPAAPGSTEVAAVPPAPIRAETAPAAPAKAPLISLHELSNRRDLWPSKVKLTKKVGFSPTEQYPAGSEFDLVDIQWQDVHVQLRDEILQMPADSTDVLDRASALMASLTPDQLAVTAQTLPQHPELWPVEVALTRELDFSGGNKIPAGRTVHLRKFEGEQLNLYDRQLANWFTASINETDVLARARERAKLPEKERTSFFARSVAAALEAPAGADKAFAEADYFLVYQAKLGCGRCAMFLPELKTFYDRMKPSHPFEVVFVSADTSAENMKQLQSKEKLPGRSVAWDKRLEAADLGTQAQSGDTLPLVFLYDRAGKLVARNQPNGGQPSAPDVLATLERKLGGAK